MKQEIETTTVVELGSVSAETKGGNFIVEDSEQSQSLKAGLSDD